MKNIFLLVAVVIGLALQSNAQSATAMPLTAGDTVVNTGTSSKVIRMTAGYAGIAIQAKATEISGTSAGTIKVQGSLDGTNYNDIGNAYTVTDVASQTTMFYITAPVPTYVRVLQTGSGTMSSVLSVRYVLRKYNQ
jgi:hypothetical protein